MKYDEPGLQATRKNKRVKTAAATEPPHTMGTGTQPEKKNGGAAWHLLMLTFWRPRKAEMA